ncbi:MAG: hypothetical protein AB7O96_00960 [Pseudobdellovibrionaceae bacterium]
MKYDEEKSAYFLSHGKRSFGERDIFGECIKLLKNTHYVKLTRTYFDPEERKEIAEYMIELWKEWSK